MDSMKRRGMEKNFMAVTTTNYDTPISSRDNDTTIIYKTSKRASTDVMTSFCATIIR